MGNGFCSWQIRSNQYVLYKVFGKELHIIFVCPLNVIKSHQASTTSSPQKPNKQSIYLSFDDVPFQQTSKQFDRSGLSDL